MCLVFVELEGTELCILFLSSFSKTLAGGFLLIVLFEELAAEITDGEDGLWFVAAGCVEMTSLESFKLTEVESPISEAPLLGGASGWSIDF